MRVTLGGDLAGFTSLGFDDHVKLFFPQGPAGADGEPPMASRDYTPRRYDPAANTLEIEFVLHDAGPASRWAKQVQPGQSLRIGGPRGSFIIPTNFDWHLLIGDDTALPAIARRLAELPADTRAVVLLEVDGPGDEIAFESAADVSVTWAHRNGAAAGSTDVLAKAFKTLPMPTGDYYAWVAWSRSPPRRCAPSSSPTMARIRNGCVPLDIGGAARSPCTTISTISSSCVHRTRSRPRRGITSLPADTVR